MLREVVGITRNSVVNAIGEVPPPLVYLPVTQDYAPAATLQVQTTGRPEPVIAGVRAQIQSLEPNLAITNVQTDRKSTRLNSSHRCISYAVFCLKKKKIN